MTDKELLDWLDRHGTFTSTWDVNRGYTLKRNEAISAQGRTFREAVESLKRRYDDVMNQRW